MKANELRIGNWIFEELENSLLERQIWSIESQRNGQSYWINNIDLEYIKPIPLTGEWFERFGFEYKKNGYYKFPIEIRLSGLVFFGNEHSKRGLNINLKYVHQLQNLYFALTGQELKLNEK